MVTITRGRKVVHLLKVLFFTLVIPIFIPIRPLDVLAQDVSIQKIIKDLQKNLNRKKTRPFDLSFHKKDASKLNILYERFSDQFPNTNWEIERSENLFDGRPSINIKISGIIKKGDHLYQLKSFQKIGFEIKDRKIINNEIINSYSILTSKKNNLPISIAIPNTVLTGTRYDLDIIFDEPIQNSIIAGGIINLTNQQIHSYKHPKIELSPLQGGGLFKSVQAPLKPGMQHWAALLAHPDGLISVTKSVKIVSNKSELIN